MNDDSYARLKQHFAAGALILGNEGRHGRPDTYHTVSAEGRDPRWTCEPHEYLAVWPADAVDELIKVARAVEASCVSHVANDAELQRRLAAALAQFGKAGK